MKIISFFVTSVFLLLFFSCGKGVERDLRDKWKFEKYIISEGNDVREERVDSVFINFMKGSTSVIVVREDGSFYSMAGDYQIIDESYIWFRYRTPEEEWYSEDSISNEIYFDKYFNWGGPKSRKREETFKIKLLTSKELELEKNDTVMVLTKY